MTPEEQIVLAINNGATCVDEFITFNDAELASYTAAVEARERERCANICQLYGDEWARLKVGAYDGRYDMMEDAASIIEDDIREN